MIYLASPYTSMLAEQREERFQAALRYTKFCMLRGETIFSPIVYGHNFSGDAAMIPFEPWQTFNEEMIIRSTELRILCLPGWKDSRGVEAEIEFALRNGIRVKAVKDIPHESV